EARFSFPEKYLATEANVDGVSIEVHNAHLPPGATRGVVKVHAFEAIRRRIDEATKPIVLCGDFNAPWSEDATGPVITRGGNWSDEVRTRWIEAEAAVITSPNIRDVYRDVHDPEVPFPVSHITGGGKSLTRHRYDYIFASPDLKTE